MMKKGNVFYHSPHHTTQCITPHHYSSLRTNIEMASTLNNELPQKEARLLLAKQISQNNPKISQRKAASSYDIIQSTLSRRIKGSIPKHESNAKKRKLLPSEEQALIDWILDLDQRGFPPPLLNVREMANVLLAGRGQNPPPQPVGKNWPTRFINDHSELSIRWNRKFNSQRAKCEDPRTINAWFQLVQETRLRYGIGDEDIFNFDETGFMMGMIATSKVVTSSDTVGRAITIQPGNRDWTTVIEGINAMGWAIPPYVILAAKVHQSGWYHNLPPDWAIAVSDNGWTNDELGFEWLKHFNTHTEARTKGTYRLLILDGHGSHATPQFDQYCTANRIITLCMPAHTSHLLQPLDVSCFSPIKHFYGQEVLKLIRVGVHHIDKEDFLIIYPSVRALALNEKNIKSGFRATGLIPYDPQRVLSNLTITKTPTPPGTAEGPSPLWVAETPHNLNELEKQAKLVRELLQRPSQSPTNQAIKQVVKSCQMAMHSVVMLAQENKELRTANERRERKKQHRRRYLTHGGVLQAQQGQFLVERRENSAQSGNQTDRALVRQRAPKTCSNCGIQGHTIRTCPDIQRII
jgi:hypothetical protein